MRVLGCQGCSSGLKHLAAPRAAVVVMCLVSIVLHRAITAVTVPRPDNTPLAAWGSFHCSCWAGGGL